MKEEFERLSIHMNWKEKQYSENRKQFTKIFFGYIEKNEHEDKNVMNLREIHKIANRKDPNRRGK